MKYGVIGCGNMGGAIARALSVSTKDIILANKTPDKAEKLAAELGVSAGSNSDVVTNCGVVFLGVKPQMLEALLGSLKDDIASSKPVLVSMAAGIDTATVEKWSGCADIPVIRIMPNMPVSVGKGVILHCRNKNVPDDVLDTVIKDLAPAGLLDEIPEHLINAGSALSGCGPAFVYMFIEALADGGVACGLPRDKALKYAEMTSLGSAEAALSSDRHPERMKDDVCSPGGTTIMGVKALEDRGFRAAVMEAVLAAYEKTVKLGK